MQKIFFFLYIFNYNILLKLLIINNRLRRPVVKTRGFNPLNMCSIHIVT
jgi:hypothetical protein